MSGVGDAIRGETTFRTAVHCVALAGLIGVTLFWVYMMRASTKEVKVLLLNDEVIILGGHRFAPYEMGLFQSSGVTKFVPREVVAVSGLGDPNTGGPGRVEYYRNSSAVSLASRRDYKGLVDRLASLGVPPIEPDEAVFGGGGNFYARWRVSTPGVVRDVLVGLDGVGRVTNVGVRFLDDGWIPYWETEQPVLSAAGSDTSGCYGVVVLRFLTLDGTVIHDAFAWNHELTQPASQVDWFPFGLKSE